MKKLLLLFVVFLMMTWFKLADARSEDFIPVQGRLTDGNDVPINDTLDMEFDIYFSETATESQWRTIRNAIGVTDGQFTVYLGEKTPLDLSDFLNIPELWIQLTVAGEAMERFRLEPVPFAYNCYGFGELDTDDAALIADLFVSPCPEDHYFRGWSGDEKICEMDQSSVIDCSACNDSFVNENQSGSISGEMIQNGSIVAAHLSNTTKSGACANICSDANTTECATCDGDFINTGEADSITTEMIKDGEIGVSDLDTEITAGACSQICDDATGSGDITAVIAGEGLSGGGESGAVTLDVAGLTDIEINPQNAVANYQLSKDDVDLATYSSNPLQIIPHADATTEHISVSATVPSKLFGIQQYFKGVSICYYALGGSKITYTYVDQHDGTEQFSSPITSSGEDHGSSTADCYSIVLKPQPTFPSINGTITVRFEIDFAGQGADYKVAINRITVHLSSDDN